MSEPTEQEWADATWARDGHVNPRHKAWVNRLIERTKAAARDEALREAAAAISREERTSLPFEDAIDVVLAIIYDDEKRALTATGPVTDHRSHMGDECDCGQPDCPNTEPTP